MSYLKTLPETRIISVHLGHTDLQGETDFPVEYYRIPNPSGFLKIGVILRHLLQIRRLYPGTAVLLPNHLNDLLLGILSLFFYPKNITWFMDDFYQGQKKTIKTKFGMWLFGRLYRSTQIRIVVSQYMARAFEGRYRLSPELVLQKRWPVLAIDQRDRPNIRAEKIRIAWVGTLLSHYTEPLKALDRLLPKDIEIDLWGMGQGDFKHIRHRGVFQDRELANILRDYDFALLTYSFDANTQGFMSTSLPGKLVDYLACGMPVISIGPSSLAVMADLKEREVGPLVFGLEDAEIQNLFQTLRVSTPAQRAKWSKNSLTWAKKDFDWNSGVQAFRAAYEGLR